MSKKKAMFRYTHLCGLPRDVWKKFLKISRVETARKRRESKICLNFFLQATKKRLHLLCIVHVDGLWVYDADIKKWGLKGNGGDSGMLALLAHIAANAYCRTRRQYCNILVIPVQYAMHARERSIADGQVSCFAVGEEWKTDDWYLTRRVSFR